MDKIILVIMSIFFVLGGIDYILDNKFGIGAKFKEGISSIGLLVLSMTGIFAISPIIGEFLKNVFMPIREILGIDISIFPAMFLAIDMGALGISSELAGNADMHIVSGVITASTLGATLSFSIPLALGLVDKKHSKEL
ncbi:MAG: ethanolamine utilization protein EutH [Sarcina sp.]